MIMCNLRGISHGDKPTKKKIKVPLIYGAFKPLLAHSLFFLQHIQIVNW